MIYDVTRTLKDIEALAEHYLAIGEREVFLGDKYTRDRPWDRVTRVEVGSTHRIDMVVSVDFYVESPSGITVSWAQSLERRDANGSSYYDIDTEALGFIMENLPEEPKQQLREILSRSARAVLVKAQEYLDTSNRQAEYARALMGMTGEVVDDEAYA